MATPTTTAAAAVTQLPTLTSTTAGQYQSAISTDSHSDTESAETSSSPNPADYSWDSQPTVEFTSTTATVSAQLPLTVATRLGMPINYGLPNLPSPTTLTAVATQDTTTQEEVDNQPTPFSYAAAVALPVPMPHGAIMVSSTTTVVTSRPTAISGTVSTTTALLSAAEMPLQPRKRPTLASTFSGAMPNAENIRPAHAPQSPIGRLQHPEGVDSLSGLKFPWWDADLREDPHRQDDHAGSGTLGHHRERQGEDPGQRGNSINLATTPSQLDVQHLQRQDAIWTAMSHLVPPFQPPNPWVRLPAATLSTDHQAISHSGSNPTATGTEFQSQRRGEVRDTAAAVHNNPIAAVRPHMDPSRLSLDIQRRPTAFNPHAGEFKPANLAYNPRPQRFSESNISTSPQMPSPPRHLFNYNRPRAIGSPNFAALPFRPRGQPHFPYRPLVDPLNQQGGTGGLLPPFGPPLIPRKLSTAEKAAVQQQFFPPGLPKRLWTASTPPYFARCDDATFAAYFHWEFPRVPVQPIQLPDISTWPSYAEAHGLVSHPAYYNRVDPELNKIIGIYTGSLKRLRTQVLVHPTNNYLIGIGGLSASLFQYGGPRLLQEIRENFNDGIPTGYAVYTFGYDLGVEFIFHAVGPTFNDPITLKQVYTKVLDLMPKLGVCSIAIPSISGGMPHYPLEQAIPVQLQAIREWLETNPYSPNITRIVLAINSATQLPAYVNQLLHIFPIAPGNLKPSDPYGPLIAGPHQLPQPLQPSPTSTSNATAIGRRTETVSLSKTVTQADNPTASKRTSTPTRDYDNVIAGPIDQMAADEATAALDRILSRHCQEPDTNFNPGYKPSNYRGNAIGDERRRTPGNPDRDNYLTKLLGRLHAYDRFVAGVSPTTPPPHSPHQPEQPMDIVHNNNGPTTRLYTKVNGQLTNASAKKLANAKVIDPPLKVPAEPKAQSASAKSTPEANDEPYDGNVAELLTRQPLNRAEVAKQVSLWTDFTYKHQEQLNNPAGLSPQKPVVPKWVPHYLTPQQRRLIKRLTQTNGTADFQAAAEVTQANGHLSNGKDKKPFKTAKKPKPQASRSTCRPLDDDKDLSDEDKEGNERHQRRVHFQLRPEWSRKERQSVRD